jgi:hypothetical protein
MVLSFHVTAHMHPLALRNLMYLYFPETDKHHSAMTTQCLRTSWRLHAYHPGLQSQFEVHGHIRDLEEEDPLTTTRKNAPSR